MRPILYSSEPVTVRGDQLHSVWWQGRQWAVTSYGIEARDGTYAIPFERLEERMGYGPNPRVPDWPPHLGGKIWVDRDDFATAFLVAIALHQSADFTMREIRDAIDLMWKHEYGTPSGTDVPA